MNPRIIRHARWIAEGWIHPATPDDIPIPVAGILDAVAYTLRAIENGSGR